MRSTNLAIKSFLQKVNCGAAGMAHTLIPYCPSLRTHAGPRATGILRERASEASERA